MSLIDSVARANPTPMRLPLPASRPVGALPSDSGPSDSGPSDPGPSVTWEPVPRFSSPNVYFDPSLAKAGADRASPGTATADVQAISTETPVAPAQDPAQVVAQATYIMVTDLLSRPVEASSRLKFA